MYRFFLETLHKNKHNIHLIKSKIICTTIWYIPSWFSLTVRTRGRNCFKAFLVISWLEPICFHTHFILPINFSSFSKEKFKGSVYTFALTACQKWWSRGLQSADEVGLLGTFLQTLYQVTSVLWSTIFQKDPFVWK